MAARAAEPSPITFRFVEAPDGLPLNVAETGPADAPGILLIHGIGQSYLSWTRQLNSELASTFHLVAFDLRGHGGSGKPWSKDAYNHACTWADDVAVVMQATGLVRPVMVLWSYGGTVGMDYVRCRGTDQLSGLVFAAARGGLYPNAQPDPRIPKASAKLEAADVRQNMQGADEFTSFLTAQPLPAELADSVRAMSLMYPPYARQANDSRRILPDGTLYQNNEDLIAKLNLPLLFVLGERDMFSNATAAEKAIRARFPNPNIRTYAGAGHWVFFEAAEQFNRDLAAFAATARGGTK